VDVRWRHVGHSAGLAGEGRGGGLDAGRVEEEAGEEGEREEGDRLEAGHHRDRSDRRKEGSMKSLSRR
jgi:hypothetical protein